ncbi:MAG: sigma-E processing peptidase SpoIIGA [Oscillospiraceae bacterium]|nr:sigma-E processing peptidase SpoIIGA [Oscillospiraceae bacterium]
MKVIYLDRLFLVNLLCDYLLCLASGRVGGVPLRRGRFALAALFGALYAVLSVLPGFSPLLSPPARLAAGLLTAGLAFAGEPHFLRCAALFLAVSALFGGALWALTLAGDLPLLDARALILSFSLCYAALTLYLRARPRFPGRARAEIRVRIGGREVRFTALRDSGNGLCDPATGEPVLLATPAALAPLFPGAELGGDPLALLQKPGQAGRFRLIPYRAVGAAGLLAAFRPEELRIDGKTETGRLVAVSESARGDGFEAIL